MKANVFVFRLNDNSTELPYKIFREIIMVMVEKEVTKLYMNVDDNDQLVAIIPNTCLITIQYKEE